MSEELKPCPFCGGEAKVESYQMEDISTILSWNVRCLNRKCLGRPFTEIMTTERAAIAAWNTRAGEAERIAAAVAAERDAIAAGLEGWKNREALAAQTWRDVNRTQYDLSFQTWDTLREVIAIIKGGNP